MNGWVIIEKQIEDHARGLLRKPNFRQQVINAAIIKEVIYITQ
jgi:hypothetical protein